MNLITEIKDGEKIPVKYTADGENVNPAFEIVDLPESTNSILVIVDDPDAKRVAGFTWIHWVVFDIPVENGKALIEENSVPGDAGESTYKMAKYGGPNPPKRSGVHHYHFKFYALDKMLRLPEMTTVDKIMGIIKGHVVDEKEIVGVYERR